MSFLWGPAYAVASFICTFPTLEKVSFALNYALVCGTLRYRLNGITRLFGGLPIRTGFKHSAVVLTLRLERKGSERDVKQAF